VFKINQNKLAKLIGINESTLYRHLNGDSAISRNAAVKYAEELNCHPAEITF